MPRVVKAGDSIRKGITARWFNEQNKKRVSAKPPQLPKLSENPIKVDCIAASGIDLARFDAANIVGPAIAYEDFDGDAVQYSSVMVKVNATLVEDRWGIVQGACLPSNASKLTVLGLTWANFDYTDGDTHVDIVTGALTSKTSGRGLIISPPEDDGLPGLILIQPSGTTGISAKVFHTPGGGIAARSGTTLGSASCSNVSVTGGTRSTPGGSATVYNDFLSTIAADVDIIALEIDGIWLVIAEDCS